jgi:hypothetical protein
MICPIRRVDICSAAVDVRFGSEADICSAITRVRFTPESGHCSPRLAKRHKALGNSKKFRWRPQSNANRSCKFLANRKNSSGFIDL